MEAGDTSGVTYGSHTFLRLWQPHLSGHPSHLSALYTTISVRYPLSVFPYFTLTRFMCCPIGQTK